MDSQKRDLRLLDETHGAVKLNTGFIAFLHNLTQRSVCRLADSLFFDFTDLLHSGTSLAVECQFGHVDSTRCFGHGDA